MADTLTFREHFFYLRSNLVDACEPEVRSLTSGHISGLRRAHVGQRHLKRGELTRETIFVGLKGDGLLFELPGLEGSATDDQTSHQCGNKDATHSRHGTLL